MSHRTIHPPPAASRRQTDVEMTQRVTAGSGWSWPEKPACCCCDPSVCSDSPSCSQRSARPSSGLKHRGQLSVGGVGGHIFFKNKFKFQKMSFHPCFEALSWGMGPVMTPQKNHRRFQTSRDDPSAGRARDTSHSCKDPLRS